MSYSKTSPNSSITNIFDIKVHLCTTYNYFPDTVPRSPGYSIYVLQNVASKLHFLRRSTWLDALWSVKNG